MKAKQYGFHTIEVALVVLVLGVAGFAGYKVMQNRAANDQATQVQEVPIAPEIKTGDDLVKASDTIDQLDTSASSAELDDLEKELDALE